MKKIVFKLFAFIFIFNTAAADNVVQEWTARYNGTGNGFDMANAIDIDASGNVYITGWSKGNGSNYDYCTVKYNSSGCQKWIARYNGPGNNMDYPVAVKTDAGGSVYVTGYSFSGNVSESSDICTIKYSAVNGNVKWVRRFNGPANSTDEPYDLVLDAEGYIYVCGYSVVSGMYADYCTIKYDTTGTLLWASYFNGPGNETDIARSIALDNSENIYVTGWSRRNQYGSSTDLYTIKYNYLGSQQWAVKYTGTGYLFDTSSAGLSIVTDNNGNIYVGGVTVNNPTYGDVVVLKYNASGVLQWSRIYNGSGSGNDAARVVKIDQSGNIFAAGEQTNFGTSEDFCTIKYNPAGTQQWVRTYNGSANSYDEIADMVLDRFGNVYITGRSYGDTSNTDYCTIKYDNNGSQQWLIRYYGIGLNSMDDPEGIDIDSSGNIYVTGSSRGDFLTVKYSQIIGIQPVSSEIPNMFSLSQNYPNPFNPKSNIKFQIAKPGEVELVIFDVLGREAATLVNEQLNPGTYEVTLDGSAYPSGVYFYRLITNDYSETKKMVLIK